MKTEIKILENFTKLEVLVFYRKNVIHCNKLMTLCQEKDSLLYRASICACKMFRPGATIAGNVLDRKSGAGRLPGPREFLVSDLHSTTGVLEH